MDWYVGQPTGERHEGGLTFKNGYAFVDAYTSWNFQTRDESPYGYGVHIINGPKKYFEGADCNYDDRLRQWKGHDEYRAALRKAFKDMPQPFRYGTLKQMSAFLTELYGKPTKCLQVCEGCNVGNGYPFYIFVSKDA